MKYHRTYTPYRRTLQRHQRRERMLDILTMLAIGGLVYLAVVISAIGG